MEVRTDPAIMSSRDSFTINIQKSLTSSPTPVSQSMRTPYAGDGPAIFRPAPAISVPAANQAGGAELPASQSPSANPPLERSKRKRGRPRKYASEGKSAFGGVESAHESSPGSTGFSLSYSSPRPMGSSSSLLVENMKKARNRPLGSGKRFQMDCLGLGGIGFTPHIITVKAGEDVLTRIMSFSHNGPRAVCILSANGAVSNVTLRQAATSGGTVTYEGRFEILSLSGSFLLSENAGQKSRTGGLSISLAGSDGRVLGGGVAGLLTAASPIQVVVGSFIADDEKKETPYFTSSDAAGKPVTAGAPGTSSPTSRGTLSESSGGGPGSPLNQSNNGNNSQQNLTNNQQSLSSMPWK